MCFTSCQRCGSVWEAVIGCVFSGCCFFHCWDYSRSWSLFLPVKAALYTHRHLIQSAGMQRSGIPNKVNFIPLCVPIVAEKTQDLFCCSERSYRVEVYGTTVALWSCRSQEKPGDAVQRGWLTSREKQIPVEPSTLFVPLSGFCQ